MFRRRLSRPDPSTAVLTALVVARSRDDLLAATLASLQETCLEPDQLRTRVVVLAPAGDEARARCRDVAARAPGVELDEAAELRAAVLRVTGDWLLLVAEGARFVRPWSVSGAVHRLLDERRALAVRFGPRVLAYDAAALRPLARARTFTDPDALEEGLARVRPRLLRRRTRLVEAGAPITVRGDLIPARAAPAGAAGPPSVSILMPCHRHARFLPTAMASVIHQTRDDWELIVVDDGSPDDTAEVTRAVAARHPGRAIRLVRQANGGLPHARNNGARFARGRYLLALDADDAIEPEYLERAVAALDAAPSAGIAVPDTRMIGVRRDVWAPRTPVTAAALAARNSVPVSSVFRRALFDAIGGWNPELVFGYEDWDFWLRCCALGAGFVRLEEPLFVYRRRHGSMEHEARRRDALIRAQLVVAHPALHPPGALERARALLARTPPPPPKPCPEPHEVPL